MEQLGALFVSLAVLIAATVAIAAEAELISAALEQTAGTLHLSPMFLGVKRWSEQRAICLRILVCA